MGAIAGSLIRSWDASAGSLCGVLDRLVLRDLGDCGRSVGGKKVGAYLLLLTIGIAPLLLSIGTIGNDACLPLPAVGLLGVCGTGVGVGGDACQMLVGIGGLGVGAFKILMISSALKRAGLGSQGVLTFIEEAESGGRSWGSRSGSLAVLILSMSDGILLGTGGRSDG